jgi:hypothetical protein
VTSNSAFAIHQPRASFTVTVIYHDPNGIDLRTLRDGNILATGPNGFTASAEFVSANTRQHSSTIVATYAIHPPAGRWRQTNNGTYTLHLSGDSVEDRQGSAAAPAILGSFTINLATNDV